MGVESENEFQKEENFMENLAVVDETTHKSSIFSNSLSNMETAETDLEKTERINKGFERVIQFMNVLGQVDSFLTDRTKNFIRKLNAAYEVDDNDIYRRRRLS